METMFAFIRTEDGSPTLRLQGNEPGALSEAMHSLKGAFSETVYIYGTAIETTLDLGLEPSVLSMGLGLGYVELLATGLALKSGARTWGGESYEIVPELRDYFAKWVEGKDDVPAEFVAVYDEILERTARHCGIAEPAAVRSAFASSLARGDWKIREALSGDTVFSRRFNCICFDAFSSKSTPDLWSEAFLGDFLARSAESSCVLATYACTGALKRSLRAAGFELQIREGFSSKRDSTFAVRRSGL